MATAVRVLTLPYDTGQRVTRMGRGPAALLPVMPPGHVAEEIDAGDAFPTEAGIAFTLAARLAERVREATASRQFPIVLSGNCLPAAVGVVAGLGPGVGVVWLDAHGDFNTPENTFTGFLDGMAVAAAAGQCWRQLATAVPGFTPTPCHQIIHVGGRAFDMGERERMIAAGVQVLPKPQRVPCPDGARGFYLHLDLDVHDPRELPANDYQTAGGLAVTEVVEFVRGLRATTPILAASITAYDPERDPQRRAAAAVARVLEVLLS